MADLVMERADLETIAARVRGSIITMSATARTPHLGSCLSCVDILVAAYWGGLDLDPARAEDPDRDRLILSKGHAAMALYAALAHRGFIALDDLDRFARAESTMGEQPIPGGVRGVEAATGSLGHGLSLAVGMAMGTRLKTLSPRILTVMSDGECNEGSVWEAAMFAAAQKLGRLVVAVDFNGWQATGRSREVMALEPLAEKWRAFGWDATEVDGHDVESLRDLLGQGRSAEGRPLAIVARTVKGKGVSFMEDDNNWHYRIPSASELEAALGELGLK